MNDSPILFSATGALQHYVVPATGRYVIEAAGAQGGTGRGAGGKGARLKGTFFLNAGDVLQIVVGRQGEIGSTPHQPAGGGGGGSFVWLGTQPAPLPLEPLLAAGGGGGGGNGPGGDAVVATDGGFGAAPGGCNGRGGEADPEDFRYSGGGGAGWKTIGALGSTPTLCGGGMQWRGGKGANYCCNRGGDGGFGGGGGGAFIGSGSGGGGGYSGGGGGGQYGPAAGGGGSYNGGVEQLNSPGAQTGHGSVSILGVPAPKAAPFVDRDPGFGVSLRRDSATTTAEPQAAAGLEGKGYF